MEQQHSLLAKVLKEEALDLFNHLPFWGPLRKKGEIHLTGSAELDVLVYPDLDVYFEKKDSKVDLYQLFGEVASLGAQFPDVISMRLEKELHKVRPHIPKGTYLQLKVKWGSRIWQIDIWHLESEQKLQQILKESKEFKAKIAENDELRDIILEAKHALKRKDGCTPSFASYYVYRAVLDEDLRSIDEIKHYVQKHLTEN